MGDQVKRNLRDAYEDPTGYLENVVHQNNIEWKKNPDERSLGFFNPVPLGTMSNFVLRKAIEDGVINLSRRDFLKKSAGIAGGSAAASIPGAKLLQKFAPEERAVTKEAIVEAAPSHEYNSLKDYLDDMVMFAKEDYKAADLRYGPKFTKEQWLKERLLADEQLYSSMKAGQAHGFDENTTKRVLNSFSPQAKKEMKEFKKAVKNYETYPPGTTWDDIMRQGRERGYVTKDSIPDWTSAIEGYVKDPKNYLNDRATTYHNSFIHGDDIPF